MLEFDRVQEENFIACGKIGGGGGGGNRKKAGNWMPNPKPFNGPAPVDDIKNNNLLHFHCESFGSKSKSIFSKEASSEVLTQNAKFYTCGRRADNHEVLPLKWKVQISLLVPGTISGVEVSTRQRCQEQLRLWLDDLTGTYDYIKRYYTRTHF